MYVYVKIGMLCSAVICYLGGYGAEQSTLTGMSILGFSSHLFFFGMLPPIIYNSGYHLRRKFLYANFLGIVLLAFVGTVISTLVVGGGLYALGQRFSSITYAPTLMECIAFGALISSTDPVSTLSVFNAQKVDPTLFYLVFGESVSIVHILLYFVICIINRDLALPLC